MFSKIVMTVTAAINLFHDSIVKHHHVVHNAKNNNVMLTADIQADIIHIIEKNDATI